MSGRHRFRIIAPTRVGIGASASQRGSAGELPVVIAALSIAIAASLMALTSYWFCLREVPPSLDGLVVPTPRPVRQMGTNLLDAVPGDPVFAADAQGWINGSSPPRLGAGGIVVVDLFDDY